MGKYCVYVHVNKENNKKYVGITSNSVKRRWANGAGYANCRLFNRAIQKYGWDKFEHQVVATGLSKEDAMIEERRLISKFKSNQAEFGYNLTTGGEVNKKISEETRKRLSLSLKGLKPSEETLKKRAISISNAWKNESTRQKHKKASEEFTNNPEYIEKLSQASKARWQNPEYIKKHKAAMDEVRKNEQFRKNHSEALKAAWARPEIRQKVTGANSGKAKPVLCITTGKTYSCAAEAGREESISSNGISMCCRGERKTAGGMQWKFA